jgi:hypothetical protein
MPKTVRSAAGSPPTIVALFKETVVINTGRIVGAAGALLGLAGYNGGLSQPRATG